MIIQLVDIFYPNLFKRYSSKYSIFRELYEKELLGLEIRDINSKFANKVKKIILSNKEICYTTPKLENSNVDLLALGSFGIFKELSKEIIALGNEDLGFKVNKTLKNILEYDSGVITIGNSNFNLDRSHVMGILNVTPDSFTDRGKYFNIHDAVDHGIRLLDEGADLVDIGGESTRPDANPVSEDEELKRVIPVIEGVLNKKPDAVISIDTQKSRVAFEALQCGVKIVNDISSFSFDEKMLEVVKRFNATLILMHMKGNPKTMQLNPVYDDVVTEVYDYLLEKYYVAQKAEIKNIIVDPGIGFGKRVMDNYELIKRLNEFKGIGAPILIGVSKKSFMGKALNLNVDEREDPTLAIETLAIKNGAKFIRSHNVKKAKYAVMLNQFIENPELLSNV